MNDSHPTGEYHLPEWLDSVGVAAWVSAPDGNIVYMNERAERMFDVEAAGVVGHPCHEVVAGRDQTGEVWCKAHCSVKQMANRGEEVEPYTVRIGDTADSEHWVQLLVIPYRNGAGDGPYLAHCAFNVDRSHLIESYLDRVAARTPLNAKREFDLDKCRLSKRELEVLELLSEDENLYSIAETLSVSYYTVRNHVQHILGKMGVHSTLEAVALFLLSKAQRAEDS